MTLTITDIANLNSKIVIIFKFNDLFNNIIII